MNWLRELLALPHYKLLSFTFALAAWLYVQGASTVQVPHRASLAWRLPGDSVATEPLPGSVVVELSGTLNAVRRADDADLVVVVDLEGASQGEVLINFADAPLIGLPPSVSVTSFQPAEHRLVLDLADTRSVAVVPEIVGEPGEGYRVAGVTVTPSVVALVGPRSVLAALRRVSTKPVDVSGLAASEERTVELDLPRGVDSVIDQVAPVASIAIEPLLQRRTIADVPLVIPGHPEMETHETMSVTLEGPRAVLSELDPTGVIGVVRLPDGVPASRVTAVCGAPDGPRVDIVHAASDRVHLVACKPAAVEVRRP